MIRSARLVVIMSIWFIVPAQADLFHPRCTTSKPDFSSDRQRVSFFRPLVFKIEKFGRKSLPEFGEPYVDLDIDIDNRRQPGAEPNFTAYCKKYIRDTTRPTQKGCWEQSGIATLISADGIFVTASHNLHYEKGAVRYHQHNRIKVFEAHPAATYAKKRRWHSELVPENNNQPLLRLIRPGHPPIYVDEIRFGNPAKRCELSDLEDKEIPQQQNEDCKTILDFSVLKSKHPIDVADRVLPDLYMGSLDGAPEVSRLYSLAYDRITSDPSDLSNPRFGYLDFQDTDRDTFSTKEFVLSGKTRPGYSGSIAFDDYGRIWGVLGGPHQDKNSEKSYYTRVGEAGELLELETDNPQNPVRRYLKILENPEPNSRKQKEFLSKLAEGRLRHIETFQTLQAIMKEWEDYKLTNPDSYRDFLYASGLRDYHIMSGLYNQGTCARLFGKTAALIAISEAIESDFGFDERGPANNRKSVTSGVINHPVLVERVRNFYARSNSKDWEKDFVNALDTELSDQSLYYGLLALAGIERNERKALQEQNREMLLELEGAKKIVLVTIAPLSNLTQVEIADHSRTLNIEAILDARGDR